MKILFSFVFFLGFNGLCLSQGITTYPSFNEKYAAQFSVADRGTILRIKNQLTQKEEYYCDTLAPVYHVQWTPDSTSLFIVEHISGGTMAVIVHHGLSGWTSVPCDPPLHYPCYYSVIGAHFLGDIVRLIFCVYPSRGSSFSEQKICIFDVNLTTGAITLKNFGPLSKKDSAKLTEQEMRRWEMWKNGTAEQEIRTDYF